jgi:hypothetical protein
MWILRGIPVPGVRSGEVRFYAAEGRRRRRAGQPLDRLLRMGSHAEPQLTLTIE